MMKLGSLTLGLCITSLQDFGALLNVWPYKGRDQAIVSNGKQIFILNVGTISFSSTLKVLYLKKVFHVLRLTTNLINVSKFCTDNDTFFEFRPKFFLVKDQVTKKALLQGHLKYGLYEFSPQFISPLTAFFTSSSIHISKPSHHMAEIWHSHLGYPSDVVLKIILTICNPTCLLCLSI